MSPTTTYHRTSPAHFDWETLARTATALGFTKESFAAWRDSLTHVPASRYTAHPFHYSDAGPSHQQSHHFAAEVWAGWPFLLTQGLPPETATHYALLRAEEAAGAPTHSCVDHRYRELEETQPFREHALRNHTVRSHVAATLAHSVPHIRAGWVKAQRKWADAQHRTAQLRESVELGRNIDRGGRRRR